MNLLLTARAAYSAAAIAVLVYFSVFLYQRAINIPFHDDIYDVLQFVMDFAAAQGFKESFDALFQQHNEHRTAASRLLYYLIYKVEGEISFRSLSFVANLAIPVLAMTFVLGAKNRNEKAFIGLICVLLLCNPRAYNQLLWPTSSFAFFYLYAYAGLALYALRNNAVVGLPLGILLATASTYSLASGKVLWVAGFVLLAWQVWGEKIRPGWHLVLWVCAAAAALFLYGYESPSPHTVTWLLKQFWYAPITVLAYTLGILGSGLSFESLPATLTVGILACSALGFIVIKDAGEGRLIWLHAFAFFIVLSALALAMGRAHYSYLNYTMEGRYSFPSLVFIACVFVLACNRGLLRASWMPPVILALVVVVSVSLYRFYTPKLELSMKRRTAQFDAGMYPMFAIPLDESRDVVLQAIERGIYSPPPRTVRPKRKRKKE